MTLSSPVEIAELVSELEARNVRLLGIEGINVAQPLVFDGDRVFISSSYGVGCAMLKVSESDGGKWTIAFAKSSSCCA